MIAVGIPSLNEADNIASLTRKIDDSACRLGLEILIINSDNNSADRTSELFQSVDTINQKVALKTSAPGKGRNIRKILEYVVKNNIDYCFFIDGDVRSFELSWLKKHAESANDDFDYVVPVYSRYYQEGNATNHFAFPLLNYLTKGKSPRQPIAGDFGVSNRLASAIFREPWPEYKMRYGIDIYVTMFALANRFNVREIHLKKKIHKPSFGKMIGIFTDEATAYFDSRNKMLFKDINFMAAKESKLIDGPSITNSDLISRRNEATLLFSQSVNLCTNIYQDLPLYLSTEEWAEVLLAHEKQVGHMPAEDIAESLCPFYLVRVLSYLRDAKNNIRAQQIIELQLNVINKIYTEAGI